MTTALKSADVKSATQAIAEKSDILYAPTDNTVASAIEGMLVAANQANTPVFGGATSYVDKGAIASIGFDYYQIGIQTAEYVAAILEGAEPEYWMWLPMVRISCEYRRVKTVRY